MSLEEKIEELTLAIHAHTDALQHLASTLRAVPQGTVGGLTAADAVAHVPAPRGRPPGSKNKVTAAPPAEPPAEKPLPESPAEQAGAKVQLPATQGKPMQETATYAEMRDVGQELAEKKGRTALAACFAKLGVTSGKEVKPAQYAEAVRLFREALAA